MKAFLENRKAHKIFLPLALVCILPIWLILLNGGTPSVPVYIIAGLGFIFFLIDRILKPRELERAEKRRLKTEQRIKAAEHKNTEE